MRLVDPESYEFVERCLDQHIMHVMMVVYKANEEAQFLKIYGEDLGSRLYEMRNNDPDDETLEKFFAAERPNLIMATYAHVYGKLVLNKEMRNTSGKRKKNVAEQLANS